MYVTTLLPIIFISKKDVKYTRRKDLEKENLHVVIIDVHLDKDYTLINIYRSFRGRFLIRDFRPFAVSSNFFASNSCEKVKLGIGERRNWIDRFLIRFLFSDIHRDSSIKCRRSPTSYFFARICSANVRRRAKPLNFTIEKSNLGLLLIASFHFKKDFIIEFLKIRLS